jgi:AraC-like DNA-binding protein
MDAAQALLLTSSHSVARIAELLGYQSPSHFTRHFKSAVGLSPSNFRLGERPHRRSDAHAQ